MKSRVVPSVVFLLVASLCGHADLVTGRVVDSQGNGVPGIDIDAIDLLTDDEATLFNDGTDANGFFVTTIPPGIYDIIFNPPPPPTTTHLVLHVEPVTVVGTKALGDVVLPPGVSLSGTVVDDMMLPVANVNLDVFDEVLGAKIDIRNGFTDGFGNFSIAVPANALEVQFDASSVIGRTLVSQVVPASPTANTVMPDVVLETGFSIVGRLLDDSLDPLKDGDIDVIDSTTGNALFTPSDGTDDLGMFFVVVPAGTWDVEICPPDDEILVATDFENLVVAANVNLGDIPLAAGVVLSGTVTDLQGAPLANVDLDVEIPMGGSIVLCGDKTNLAGAYSIVVPNGTYEVIYDPPFSQPYTRRSILPVSVAGNTLQDAKLSPCPFAEIGPGGVAGRKGIVPRLDGFGGAPRAANTGWALELSDGLGGADALLVLALVDVSGELLGGVSSSGPYRGTTFLKVPSGSGIFRFDLTLGGPTNKAGAGSTLFNLPVPLSLLVGQRIVAQAAVFDPFVPGGVSITNTVRVGFCP